MCWMWCCKDAFRPLAYWHNWHLNGFSPVCTIICLFIVPFCDIIIGQKGHWYFPTPSFMGSFCKKSRKNFYLPNECVYFQNIMLCAFFICERRFEFLLEEYWQNWQEKGFSPVCIMICLLMPCVFFIILGQNGHPYCPAPSFMGSFCKEVDKTFICKMFIFKQL